MEAFEELIYRYDRHVLAIAASFRHSREDARDIYQEVFLRVYKSIKNFEGKSEFSTWLYRIATNVCLTFKSQNKKHQHASIDEEYESDESSFQPYSNISAEDCEADRRLMDEEITGEVRKAIETLSPQQKMVFTLKHLEEMKIKDIAKVMQCSEGTVKSYLFAATRKMRDKLKDFYL